MTVVAASVVAVAISVVIGVAASVVWLLKLPAKLVSVFVL